jgi:hypothetical protein
LGRSMDEPKPSAESTPPPTLVPTAYGIKLTLEPGETVDFSIPVTEAMILDGIVATADGPALLRLKVVPPATAGTPTVEGPGVTFTDYLADELPTHLAAEAGETLEAWQATNTQLTEAARDGDDEAFFALLSRDPRALTSELTLCRTLTWRTQIQRHVRFYRFKASRFIPLSEEAATAQRQADEARRNLTRLGQSQLAPFDLRGQRPLPSPGLVQGTYYGLLCVLQGLRAWVRHPQQTGTASTRLEERVGGLVTGLASLRGASPFLPYIALAAELIGDATLRDRAGLAGESLLALGGTRGATPSHLAQAVTAAAFEVSADTIERICARSVVIPLSRTDTEWVGFVGRPAFTLLELPEVQAFLATLPR